MKRKCVVCGREVVVRKDGAIKNHYPPAGEGPAAGRWCPGGGGRPLRAIDDPVKLARAAGIMRAAMARHEATEEARRESHIQKLVDERRR